MKITWVKIIQLRVIIRKYLVKESCFPSKIVYSFLCLKNGVQAKKGERDIVRVFFKSIGEGGIREHVL